MAKRKWESKPQPGENANNVKHTMRVASLPLIDQTDKTEVATRIEEYFDLCIEDDMRPTVAGLALALGTNRTSLFDWKAGKTQRIPEEVIGLIDRAIAILNAEQEEAVANSGNIVGSIFLMKNSFEEYTDKREIIHKVEQRQLTQDELIEKLREQGFYATQATISRDIKELRIVKELTNLGTYRYTTSSNEMSGSFTSRLNTIFRECVVGIDYAQNIIVIRTLPGLASAAGSAIDSMNMNMVVGTLAGDDTVVVIMRDNNAAAVFCGEIAGLIN